MCEISEKVCQRLANEIHRVGVAEISRLTGVARSTIYNWTDRGNTPLDKFALLSVAGVDVVYVLTGTPAAGTSVERQLPPRTAALVKNFEHMTESDKSVFERQAFALAQPHARTKTG